MFFGLTNSPATFQMMMNEIFHELINKGCISTYIDDIMIYLMDLEEHRSTIKHVMALLQEHDLYLKPEKCESIHPSALTEVRYLSPYLLLVNLPFCSVLLITGTKQSRFTHL